MLALDALKNRISHGKLQAPGPTTEQRSEIEAAALRAADHGCLRPWRYLYIEGEGREELGRLYLDAAQAKNPDLDDSQKDRFLKMPFRAPCMYVAIANIQEHPKVPREEQLMAAAASVQNMITAAFALGVGAYWRSGELAFDSVVKQGLGLAENEEIVGFVYMGTPQIPNRKVPELQASDFFKKWPL
ncbi:nitroreductase family protein [Pseudoteredinibacter isoporae]|uniref:Putative NAD(P)H nitroreductase n=1 Tax=Pseudoteredinibacter isoporae TaxID=570281 RepID=A0A7X0JXE2_9GAMM|nr:nitroreductase [Pseudoteredinibacter isoporae]MBB6523270.1 nitroreductase [Pseudoteredinibacter isoporae]NHO88786.1 nitroreductase [Pseudoteredinibacter isoporae]NIB22523.1 nitroreductase [Pseudoteredinibacter isoporae]